MLQQALAHAQQEQAQYQQQAQQAQQGHHHQQQQAPQAQQAQQAQQGHHHQQQQAPQAQQAQQAQQGEQERPLRRGAVPPNGGGRGGPGAPRNPREAAQLRAGQDRSRARLVPAATLGVYDTTVALSPEPAAALKALLNRSTQLLPEELSSILVWLITKDCAAGSGVSVLELYSAHT